MGDGFARTKALLERSRTTHQGVTELKFQGWLWEIYDDPMQLPEGVRNQLRQAFYSGAAMYQGDVLGAFNDSDDHLTDVEDALLTELLDTVCRELEDFSRRMNEAVAARRARARPQ